ncbi:YfjI family protein [Streptomyces sp. NPDC059455]|uniref:YfjI family protein n=1 Tax=Streptomyces sp. NPDC059455 TaxID=3346837 RepID=UPI0036AFCE2D
MPTPETDLWAGFDALTAQDVTGPVWDEPVPLTVRRELPAFPLGTLPPWLRDYVAAVAEETQTPADMAGSLALAVLASAAGGRTVVHIRGRWREPTNLFVVVALPPANRKSAVFSLMTEPLYIAEKTMVTESASRIVEAELTARLAKEAADHAAAKAARAESGKRDELVAEAIGLAQVAESLTVPAVPRLLADDATPEVIASLLAEQGGRLAVMSAEGGIFDIIAGRYSGTPNMEVFLKGQAGDRLRVDRRGREEFIESPALTMGLAVQPSVLKDIGKIKGFDERGLLARFLYALPQSLVGRRKILPDPIPDAVAETYERNITALALALADWTDPAVLQLSPGAHDALVAFEERQEPRLEEKRGDLGHVSKWAGKLAGTTARLAGLLHLATHLKDGHTKPIDADTLHAAVQLTDYFTDHALSVFDLMGADDTANRARTILDTLRTHQWAEVSKRDLMVKLSRSEFPTAADLDTPLELLEDHGYIRRQAIQRTGGRGRPPSPRYLTHPQIHEPTI